MNPKDFFQEGENCWRLESASRVKFLFDAADYFSAFFSVVQRAQRSILVCGWDLNSQISLLRTDERTDGFPIELGPFLDAVVSKHPELHAHVLVWDFSMIYAMDREMFPIFRLDWSTHPRLHFHMDDVHPVGASHHQKIVVVDDTLAFVGGVDLAQGRWDTSEHKANDPRRVDPSGIHYPPTHDIQMMVEGDVAAALGDLARERWQRATGISIEPPNMEKSPKNDLWPPDGAPDMENVPVAISRTWPEFRGKPQVREIESLYLDSIRAARQLIYIENQYFSSNAIGEALEESLQETDGPEVFLIQPKGTGGWLEESTMGAMRARLIDRLRDADRYGRFHVFYPMIPELKEEMTVHAKVMVVDDTLVCVGSSNLNNRSMGLDTECNLCIVGNEDRMCEAIARFRNRLLAEHLGISEKTVSEAYASRSSLAMAMEDLSEEGKGLSVLDCEVDERIDRLLPDSAIMDPEKPVSPEEFLSGILPQIENPKEKSAPYGFVAVLGGMILLAALWRWSPLNEWLTPEWLSRWAAGFQGEYSAPLLVTSLFIIGSVIMIPVMLMILAVALSFDPIYSFGYALMGSLASAASTYYLGYFLGRNTVRKLGGSKLNKLSRRLGRQGLAAVALVRLLPLAPFTVINMVAGASHIRFSTYLLGTFLGMGPGILGITLFSSQLKFALSDPGLWSFILLGVIVIFIVGGTVWVQKKFGSELDVAPKPSVSKDSS